VENPEVLIIGAGPGGYVAGIRLGQLGKRVLVVDKDRIGGVCLNRGCIPTKALLSAMELKTRAERGGRMGISVDNLRVDIPALEQWKNSIVDRLVKGVESLFKRNGVEFIKTEARFIDERRVRVGDETLEPENIIIATGSHPLPLPGVEFDHKEIIDSDDALNISDIPKDLLIVGAGAVGLEFATIYSRLGSRVTVVEMMDQILPGMDSEVAQTLLKILKHQGIEVILNAKVREIKREPLRVVIEDRGEVETDRVLIAIGRRPCTQDFRELGVELDASGFVRVDEFRQTSVKGIYGVGDITGPPLLAHKAMREGIVAAERIAGTPSAYNSKAIPLSVFTDPELASVGLSEDEAKEMGYDTLVGRFPLIASGRALTLGYSQGMAKVVADKKTDKILGVHILAPEASSLISAGVVGVERGIKVKDFASLVQPHPTMSEILLEACENLHKKAIHIPNG